MELDFGLDYHYVIQVKLCKKQKVLLECLIIIAYICTKTGMDKSSHSNEIAELQASIESFKKMYNNMKYIIDTDFIPSKFYSHTAYQDLYQLVYGILYGDSPNFDKVYNTIVLLTQRQGSDILKKVKLEMWKRELSTTIKNLEMYKNANEIVIVRISFTYYEETLETTLNLLNFANNTIGVMLQSDLDDLTLQDVKDEKSFPIPSMYKLFSDYYISYRNWSELILDEDACDVDEELSRIEKIYVDEVIRRGLYLQREETEDYPFSRNTPSEFYSNRNLFKELEIDRINSISPTITAFDVTSEPTIDNSSLKDKAGVIYYMLKDVVKDDDLIITLINFVNDRIYNKDKRKGNSDSVKRYVYSFRKKEVTYNTAEYVKDVLSSYDLEIPEELKIKKPQGLD